MGTTTRKQIDEFWTLKRLAVVGVSRDEKDFSRALFRELKGRGYTVIPVNPQADKIEGQPCYPQVSAIPEKVDGVVVMTPAAQSEQVVRDCASAGVQRIWLHRGEGIGAVSPAAVSFCEQHGMQVVEGYCPFMFLPGTPFFHRFHGFFKKLQGTYPN